MEEVVPSAKKNQTLQIAREVDRVASADEYFKSRNLCANTDLYVSFVYTALGIPPSHVLSMVMAARMAGMLAHWREAMGKSSFTVTAMSGLNSDLWDRHAGQTISLWRPQQIYTGSISKDV
jgi:citrate synthase